MRNVIKRAALLTASDEVELTSLPFEMVNHAKLLFDENTFSGKAEEPKAGIYGSTGEKLQSPVSAKVTENPLKAASIDGEYETIVMALKKVNYNKSKAAKILNIDRKTLYNKMKQYKEFNEG